MNPSDSDVMDSARQALADGAALAPMVPLDLLRVVERRGRRARTMKATVTAICAIGVAATAGFALTTQPAPSPHVVTAPTATSRTGLPVVFAPVEQFRPRQDSCTSGWFPGPDGCYRLAPDSLRVDHPRNVELITGQGMSVVRLTMSDSDADRFQQITALLAPRRGQLGILVDDRVVAAPEIQAPISGPSMEIPTSGPQEADALFQQIR